MTGSVWYLNNSGTQTGPHTADEIKTLRLEAKATSESLIWREGMPEWKRLAEVPELYGASSFHTVAPQEVPPAEELQFEKAVPVDAAATTSPVCVSCQKPLSGSYFTLNGSPICSICRVTIETALTAGSASRRLARAVGAGSGAAAVGAIAWFAIAKLTGMELGIVAIVLGFFVGSAVRWGSEGRGGRVYQALAVFLTYTAIVSSYVPMILTYLAEQNQDSEISTVAAEGIRDTGVLIPASDTPAAAATFDEEDTVAAQAKAVASHPLVAFLILIGFVYALPFLAGFENIVGIIIIGIALYQAWKMNEKTILSFEGPFQIQRPV